MASLERFHFVRATTDRISQKEKPLWEIFAVCRDKKHVLGMRRTGHSKTTNPLSEMLKSLETSATGSTAQLAAVSVSGNPSTYILWGRFLRRLFDANHCNVIDTRMGAIG
jgi:hypothetical protein